MDRQEGPHPVTVLASCSHAVAAVECDSRPDTAHEHRSYQGQQRPAIVRRADRCLTRLRALLRSPPAVLGVVNQSPPTCIPVPCTTRATPKLGRRPTYIICDLGIPSRRAGELCEDDPTPLPALPPRSHGDSAVQFDLIFVPQRGPCHRGALD